MRTACTEVNVGHHFHGCSRFGRESFCGYREWIDDEILEHITLMLLDYKKMKRNLGYERNSRQTVEVEEGSGEKDRFEQRMARLEGDVRKMKTRHKFSWL